LCPSTTANYLGLELDMDALEAHLPHDKLDYLRSPLQGWLDHHSCSLCKLQELTGFLQFCSQVIPHLHGFLCCLIDFSCTFKSQYLVCHLPASALADIRWWYTYAASWNGVCLISPSYLSVHVYTNASGTKGIGGIHEDNWFSSRVPHQF